jgi:hypothetical protein
MLVDKPKPQFWWMPVNPQDVISVFIRGNKSIQILRYGEDMPGAVFSPDGKQWWFRANDGWDSKLAGEPGQTLAQARKALVAHARYTLGLIR